MLREDRDSFYHSVHRSWYIIGTVSINRVLAEEGANDANNPGCYIASPHYDWQQVLLRDWKIKRNEHISPRWSETLWRDKRNFLAVIPDSA